MKDCCSKMSPAADRVSGGVFVSKQLFLSVFLVACLMSLPARVCGQRTPIPPGVREADKQTNAPIEPPATFKQKPVDPGLLRQEAKELAKLSAALLSQMDQVSRGKIPKDLGDELKRIEKLAKHLRSEISR